MAQCGLIGGQEGRSSDPLLLAHLHLSAATLQGCQVFQPALRPALRPELNTSSPDPELSSALWTSSTCKLAPRAPLRTCPKTDGDFMSLHLSLNPTCLTNASRVCRAAEAMGGWQRWLASWRRGSHGRCWHKPCMCMYLLQVFLGARPRKQYKSCHLQPRVGVAFSSCCTLHCSNLPSFVSQPCATPSLRASILVATQPFHHSLFTS